MDTKERFKKKPRRVECDGDDDNLRTEKETQVAITCEKNELLRRADVKENEHANINHGDYSPRGGEGFTKGDADSNGQKCEEPINRTNGMIAKDGGGDSIQRTRDAIRGNGSGKKSRVECDGDGGDDRTRAIETQVVASLCDAKEMMFCVKNEHSSTHKDFPPGGDKGLMKDKAGKNGLNCKGKQMIKLKEQQVLPSVIEKNQIQKPSRIGDPEDHPATQTAELRRIAPERRGDDGFPVDQLQNSSVGDQRIAKYSGGGSGGVPRVYDLMDAKGKRSVGDKEKSRRVECNSGENDYDDELGTSGYYSDEGLMKHKTDSDGQNCKGPVKTMQKSIKDSTNDGSVTNVWVEAVTDNEETVIDFGEVKEEVVLPNVKETNQSVLLNERVPPHIQKPSRRMEVGDDYGNSSLCETLPTTEQSWTIPEVSDNDGSIVRNLPRRSVANERIATDDVDSVPRCICVLSKVWCVAR